MVDMAEFDAVVPKVEAPTSDSTTTMDSATKLSPSIPGGLGEDSSVDQPPMKKLGFESEEWC